MMFNFSFIQMFLHNGFCLILSKFLYTTSLVALLVKVTRIFLGRDAFVLNLPSL